MFARHSLPVAVLLLLAACVKTAPIDSGVEDSDPSDTHTDSDLPAPTVLWVSGYNSDTVHRVDVQTGALLGDLGPVPGAQSVQRGPDGALYLVAEKDNQVLRHVDGVSAPFVLDDPATEADETGGLRSATSAVWGPDGMLYVSGFASDSVHRYDAQGDFVDVFAEGVDGPDAGMAFNAEGQLVVPCFEGDEVQVLDGSSGALLQTFDEALRSPRALHFAQDGTLWVSAWASSRIRRFDAQGVLGVDIAQVPTPTGMVLGPEGLWVGDDQDSVLSLVDVETGEVVRTIDGAALGIDGVTWIGWEG